MPDKLKTALLQRSERFEAAAEVVATHLRHLLRGIKIVDPGVVATRVSSRAKGIKSVMRKVGKKQTSGRPYRSVRGVENQIDDLAGARVVCDYLGDVAYVYAYLQRHPAFKVLTSKTEDYIERPKFGYRGIHVCVEVETYFGRVRCEVQIRTMLQHAWAEKSHDLLYKLKKSEMSLIPRPIRNMMEGQSNFLYDLDTMAMDIATAIRGSLKEKK